MAELSELSLEVRAFMRLYPWRRINPVPWTPLKKPLSNCRLALVSTAAFVVPGQPRFDEHVRGGDTSFREIPIDVDLKHLTESHRSQSFDHSGIQADPNLGFPIERVRELAASGRIGSMNHRHLSFMGSITAPGRLTRDSAPQAAKLLVEDGVEIALLVPV
jgi:D-proline reductase (dithiol) PrdB